MTSLDIGRTLLRLPSLLHPVRTDRFSRARTASWLPRVAIWLVLTLIILSVTACNRQGDSETASIADESTASAARSIPTDPPPTSPPLSENLVDASPTLTITLVTVATATPSMSLLPTPTPSPLPTTEAPAPAPLPDGVVQDADLVNVRAAPDLNAAVIGIIPSGTAMQVEGASRDGRWLKVCCPVEEVEEQWIVAEYVAVDGPVRPVQTPASGQSAVDETVAATGQIEVSAPNTDDADVTAASADGEITAVVNADGEITAVVNADLVNLRNGPGTGYGVAGQLVGGAQIAVLGRNADASWLQVCCGRPADEPSWIRADLLDVAAGADLQADAPEVDAPPLPTPAPAAAPNNAPAAAAPASAPGLPGDGGFGAPGGTNPLTGLPFAGNMSDRRPVIVCINNDYAARPQFGISQADVMYEYLMEGFGITRFSGVFFGESVAQIGPVRSARLINYYMGALYNGGLVCSGASDPVRYTLKHEAPFPYMDIDLDDPSNTRYSVSIGSDYRTRLRTTTDQLQQWLADWGVQQPASVRGFSFGNAPAGGAPASAIFIPYPGGTGSQVSYVYDAGSGRYLRLLGGIAHLDGNTGQQVAVDNVIVQYVPHQITDIVEDSLGSKSIRLNLFGSGRAIVFRNGQAYPGVWRSESRGDLPRFFAEDGSEVALKPGKSWISIVPPDRTVDYQ